MKYLIIIAMTLPFLAGAQAGDCKLVRDTDSYTKQTRLSTGFIKMTGAQLNIESDGKEIDLFFIVADKCFADGSNVYVYFEGIKARMFYRNTGSMNCDGYVHIKFPNRATPNTTLKRFATNKVNQIIFVASDKKEKVITLTDEEKDQLQQLASCLIEEASQNVK